MFEMGCIEDPDDEFEVVRISNGDDGYTAIERKAPKLPAKTAEFELYHRENPAVLERMIREAREWVQGGGTRLGIGMLVAHIRWIGQVEQWNDFKINENHGAFYARLIQVECPELIGVFEMRAAEADDWVIARYPDSALADKIEKDRTRRRDEATRWNRKATTR